MQRNLVRFLYLFQTYFVCLNILVFSSPVFANEIVNKDSKIQKLLQMQAWMKGQQSKVVNKVVMSEVQKFISDPKNKNTLSSLEGRNLVEQHARVLNYTSVKRVMDDCSQKRGDVNGRNLRVRISDLTLAAQNCAGISNTLLEINDFDKLSEQLIKITNSMTKIDKAPGEFENKIIEQSLVNSLKTLMNVKYKYEQGFIPDNGSRLTDRRDLIKILRTVCPDKKSCDPAKVERFNTIINSEMKRLRSSKEKTSIVKALHEVNKKFDRLNVLLAAIPLKSEGGVIKTPFWDTSDASVTNEATIKTFKQYTKSYIAEASRGDGNLLLTDAVRDESGGLRQLEDDDLNENTKYLSPTIFTFRKHKKVLKINIKNGVNEIKKKIKSQIRALNSLSQKKKGHYRELVANGFKAQGFGVDLKDWKQGRKDNLKKLIKTNPAAVGEILVQTPEYAGIVCETIQDIESDDKSDQSWDKAWMWGGIIVGGAVALTGVGAGVGAAIIAGSTAAGTVAAIGTAAFVTGAVAGGMEAAYWGSRTYQHDREIIEMERAFIAGNSDGESIEESRRALSKYKETRLNAALALGFGLVDVGALKVVGKLGKGTIEKGKSIQKVLSPKQVENLSEIYKIAYNQKHLNYFKKTIKLLGLKGAHKLDKFFTELAQISEVHRIKLLKRIQDGRWTSQKLQQVIEESLAAVKKGCH